MDLLSRRAPFGLRLGSGLGVGAVLAAAVIGPGLSSGAAAQAPMAPGSSASSHAVQVGDNFFRPSSLRIRRGGTVTWTWVGRNPHNVTFTSLNRHSRDQTSGTFRQRFSRAGTFRYLCTIHGFRGTIVVR